ncbi:PWI domain-containing protein [Babesia ovis]|uniref:PWI domain-containing protein n=1 Tax=Babesia ovis TaxID=5869 RepID=A0A9W5WTX4_BABOV|nr:PWI domain-containing protein [Babesia ovis]
MRGSRFSRDSGDLKTPFLAGKERELLESKKWPACFSQSVDITKVQIDAFKPWISRRVTELMGVEDEIVVDYCISQLKFFGETDAKANTENAGDGGIGLNEKPYLDPKKLQINLTGFMAKNARVFVKELWDLLLAAQENEYGIPQMFIDEKKQQIATSATDSSTHQHRINPSSRTDESALESNSNSGHRSPVGDRDRSVDPKSRRSRTRSISSSRAWYKNKKYTTHRKSGYSSKRRYDSPRGGSIRRRLFLTNSGPDRPVITSANIASHRAFIFVIIGNSGVRSLSDPASSAGISKRSTVSSPSLVFRCMALAFRTFVKASL